MSALSETVWRDASTRVAREFLDVLLAQYTQGDLQVRLWDGSTWGSAHPRFALVIKHAGALRRMFESPNELALGAAYIFDDFDIQGDIFAAVEFGEYLFRQEYTVSERLSMAALLRKLPAEDGARSGHYGPKLKGWLHSKERDRQAISYHYDLPTEFYALWLDPGLVYSCAYFLTPDDDLETAQRRKLDYLCRKLRLRPGEHLLDVGCGWGALVRHAAEHYGVEAVGITLSASQAQVGNERIGEAGLDARCRIELRDYRELDGEHIYDKIVSVGMFEHVGRKLLPEYFTRAGRLLKPGGVFLNHGIAYAATWVQPKPSFSDTYVFPDGELAPLNESLQAAEKSGFEVRDVESLREHYALTLERWVRRLEDHAHEARRLTSETTYRTWRLYMAGSAQRFQRGRIGVYQALLAKPDHGASGLPLTRADWYRE